jgi:hypothetical protein
MRDAGLNNVEIYNPKQTIFSGFLFGFLTNTIIDRPNDFTPAYNSHARIVNVIFPASS